MSRTNLLLPTCLLVFLTACGSEAPIDEAADGGALVTDAHVGTGRYLPLAVGASWTFAVSSPGQPTVMKTSTVEAFEDVGGMKAGTMAFRVRTEKTDGATVSWQAAVGDTDVRHREQSFDLAMVLQSDQWYTPHKLRLDESAAHTASGASWTDAFTEIDVDPVTMAQATVMKAETWTVEAVDEQVTVPAGTFVCLRVHRVGGAAGQSDKRFWFARGVGKIREESVGGGQVEELVSYNLP